jgi:DHA3 family tetracycline resistance protein-like MFS transporter
MFLTSTTAICMVAFGLARSFWLAVTAYCLSIALRVTSDPIIRTWINQNTESSVRATVLSTDSQVNSLGQMIGAPTIGAIGSAISLQAALVTAGLARVPVAMLFARLVFRDKGQREPGRGSTD